MQYLKYEKENPEFLNEYLKYKEFVELKPSSTIDSYYYDIRTFLRFLVLWLNDKKQAKSINKEDFFKISIKDISIDDLNKVDRFTIINYTYFIGDILQNDATSRNRKISAIKKLFQYFTVNNYIYIDPTMNMDNARIDKKLPRYLSLEESKLLLSSALQSDDKYKIRNYAIICLFLNTGMRLSELVGIDTTDLKLDERSLRILGKGNKERIIYLDDASVECINEYLKVRPKLNRLNKDYYALFLSARQQRISKRAVQQIIDKESKQAFNEKANKVHTHSLRHTCATLLWDKANTDSLTLRTILGHKTLTATSIYTHISSETLKEIMRTKSVSVLIEQNLKEEY